MIFLCPWAVQSLMPVPPGSPSKPITTRPTQTEWALGSCLGLWWLESNQLDYRQVSCIGFPCRPCPGWVFPAPALPSDNHTLPPKPRPDSQPQHIRAPVPACSWRPWPHPSQRHRNTSWARSLSVEPSWTAKRTHISA